MKADNYYKGIKHTAHISSNRQWCEICRIDLRTDIGTGINHFIDKHGYELLHVGSESDGKESITVAVMGLRD